MVFSSITFLFYFLPLVFLCYFIVPKKGKNIVLLIASFIFYFYGEPKYIVVLIISCLLNYYFGKLVAKSEGNIAKRYLIINLIINFGMLFYFKYFNFLIDNINNLFNSEFALIKIIMPIGISFFTFQATSYVIDIYRKRVAPAKNIWTFATYLSLFPQLIAGPIVRYETVADELDNRVLSVNLFSDGVKRFIVGLSKKVLLANVLGEAVSIISGLTAKTVLSHWMSAIFATFQLYFDFSGYSDMAIGLGLMFGFRFLENFNYPLIARSITDFWRRWHISLSSWLKDYIYIPLGGSKCGSFKQYRNIIIVWLVTGLWHGANWNFILWGLYFGILLIIEKKFLLKFLDKHRVFSHLYTFILVVISFVIFNHEDLSSILVFLKSMMGLNGLAFINMETIYYLRSYLVVFIIAIIAITPILGKVVNKLRSNERLSKLLRIAEPVLLLLLLVITVSFIVDESFNPFLYFRF
ncbi:MAG: MBOAT family O-acyltransferase [Bacilli bacterium]